jgi:hypothetical protein
MKRFYRRKVFWIPVSAYMLLWVLTATWGNSDLDRRFDEEYAYGYVGWPRNIRGGGYFESEKVPIDRIDWFNVKDLYDPQNAKAVGERKFFRYRSRGIPVAPFLIVDDIAEARAVLMGHGATRLNFWFFGFSKAWSLRVYWAA